MGALYGISVLVYWRSPLKSWFTVRRSDVQRADKKEKKDQTETVATWPVVSAWESEEKHSKPAPCGNGDNTTHTQVT